MVGSYDDRNDPEKINKPAAHIIYYTRVWHNVVYRLLRRVIPKTRANLTGSDDELQMMAGNGKTYLLASQGFSTFRRLLFNIV